MSSSEIDALRSELERLTLRHRKMAEEKSSLAAINHLYHALSENRDLPDLIDTLLTLVMALYGGTGIGLYYRLEESWFHTDIGRAAQSADIAAVPLVQQALREKIPIRGPAAMKSDSGFLLLGMQTDTGQEDLAFPLTSRSSMIGVLVIGGVWVRDEGMLNQLDVFLRYASILLENGIENYREIRLAYQELETVFDANPDAMFVIDEDHIIQRANSALARLLEEPESAMIGRSCRSFISSTACCDPCCPILRQLEENPAYEQDVTIRTNSGREIDCIVSARPLRSPVSGRQRAVVNFKDITGRKRAELSIERALLEKETLLREIHHRVKNNMQIMCSLLHLQQSRCDDPRFAGVLADCESRIQSMALVHTTLYGSENLAQVDLQSFFASLTSALRRQAPPRIELHVQAAPIATEIETAIPIALIANELILNSIKHAFPDGKSGKVNIRLEEIGTGFSFVVSDDGVGFEGEAITEGSSGSLGMLLVKALTEQLDGTLSCSGSDGTTVTILVPGRVACSP